MSDSYYNLTKKELRNLARDRGILGYYLMSKDTHKEVKGKTDPILLLFIVNTPEPVSSM